MSGRAGRRGKDERGICIIMIDEKVWCVIITYLKVCSTVLFVGIFPFLDIFILKVTMFLMFEDVPARIFEG